MNKQKFSMARVGATGYEGLVAAVIHQAVYDLRFGGEEYRQDAVDYFYSDIYQQHLGLLGLPEDWLPEAEQFS